MARRISVEIGVVFLVAIYALSAVGMAVFQRRFLYFPDWRLTHPAEAGLGGIEELRLTTEDGETIIAWHLPPSGGHPLILYFHGNGGALAGPPLNRAERQHF